MALEAYSWGKLTSGVCGMWGWITRVLWLTLLPFALVNRQSSKPEQRAHAWGGAGASVMLGAATMVALLFSSAAAAAVGEAGPLALAGDVVLEGARVVHDGAVMLVILLLGAVVTALLVWRFRNSAAQEIRGRVEHDAVNASWTGSGWSPPWWR